jgi:hypothetical protein
MKIKGPGSYSGPPAPSEPEGTESKPVSKFDTQEVQTSEATQKKGSAASGLNAFEKGLQEIARASRTGGEVSVTKIVDTVLEEFLGKDFASRPDGVAVRDAIVPLINQDEHLMGKLNSILSRLEKS